MHSIAKAKTKTAPFYNHFTNTSYILRPYCHCCQYQKKNTWQNNPIVSSTYPPDRTTLAPTTYNRYEFSVFSSSISSIFSHIFFHLLSDLHFMRSCSSGTASSCVSAYADLRSLIPYIFTIKCIAKMYLKCKVMTLSKAQPPNCTILLFCLIVLNKKIVCNEVCMFLSLSAAGALDSSERTAPSSADQSAHQ